jgi:hypothetical protein
VCARSRASVGMCVCECVVGAEGCAEQDTPLLCSMHESERSRPKAVTGNADQYRVGVESSQPLGAAIGAYVASLGGHA